MLHDCWRLRMSNEPEEALEDRIDRMQRRAENFRDLLKEGEEITITFFDGKMKVEESYRAQFERKHSKLFGRMLSVEAQLNTGWVPYFLGLVVVGVVLFGLQLGWWESGLGKNVCDNLNSYWFYLVLPAAVLYLMSLGCGQWQKWAYRRHRLDLLDLIAAEKLDRDVLLVMMRDLEDLDRLILELKLDRGPFPPAG
jgi:hypothetical protein